MVILLIGGYLWKEFIKEIQDLGRIKDIGFYFKELFWLLEKYTWCIPSATNVFPDISLFDHAKTTAAIASVQYLVSKEEKIGEPDFILSVLESERRAVATCKASGVFRFRFALKRADLSAILSVTGNTER